MKKHAIHIIAILSTATLCLTGCQSNQNSGGEKRVYDNLIYTEDFTIEQPELQALDTFEMIIKPDLSIQELYILFDQKVEQYFPKVFSAEEKELLYDINGVDQNGNTLQGTEYDNDGHPLIGGYAKNAEKLLNGELPTPWLWFNSSKGMIQMFPNGSLQSVTCDAAYKLDFPTGNSVGMYCAADENTVVEKIHIPIDNFESNISYQLLDSKLSLQDAISFTKQFLQSSDIDISDERFLADVTDIWVVDMGDGIFGYHLWLTSSYNGIRLDTMPMKEGIMANYDDTECNHYYDLHPGYAFMIESDKLDSIMAFNFRRAYQIENIQQHEKILSYEEAEQKLSESLSGVSRIQLSRAELVYTPYFDNEEKNTDHMFVDSAWKFIAKNENDGYDYVFYVDSISGEVEYYKYW